MKKLKKHDFKKLALMGIAGGTTLATQLAAQSTENTTSSQMLALSGCGGGCGGKVSARGARNQPPATYYYDTQSPSQGCQGMTSCSGQQQWIQQSCQGMNNQAWPQQACQSMNPYDGQWQSAPQAYYNSCNAMPAPQQSSYYGPGPAYSGCNAMPQPQTQGYSQWEPQDATADAMKTNNAARPSSQYYDQHSNDQRFNDQRFNDQQFKDQRFNDKTKQKSTQRSMSESELLPQLNAQGKATYQSLDAAGKALALKLANQACKGENECKGMNSCKTKDNSCAGQGGCQGTSPGPFKDKNLAIKVAAKKMAEKRANAASPRY